MALSLDGIANDMSDLDLTILTLLESNDRAPVRGKTLFQKEMFIIGNYLKKIGEKADFIPHIFGPFSEPSENSLNDLISLGLVESENNIFKITDDGILVLEIRKDSVSDDSRESISDFKRFMNGLTRNEILLFTYVSYPKFTVESSIYGEVMRNRVTHSINIYKKGKISLGKAASLAGLSIESFLSRIEACP